MTGVPGTSAAFDIERLLVAMRPKLHRYCARMTGSVIDGEDVLQDALIKAVEARAAAGAIGNPEGWLFRIAHNTALDFLRRRNRQEALRSGEEVEMIADQLDAVESRQIAATSLRTFMRLPVAQRSSVILMDVLGCSLQEICEVMECSLPAAKAALHRGRAQLREIADEPDDTPQQRLSDADRARLGAYVAAFQRARFRRDPRHDRRRCAARSRQQDSPATARPKCPAISAITPRSVTGVWSRAWSRDIPLSWCSTRTKPDSRPKYFMLLGWAADKVATIRDFRHAPYVIDGAEYLV